MLITKHKFFQAANTNLDTPQMQEMSFCLDAHQFFFMKRQSRMDGYWIDEWMNEHTGVYRLYYVLTMTAMSVTKVVTLCDLYSAERRLKESYDQKDSTGGQVLTSHLTNPNLIPSIRMGFSSSRSDPGI